MKAAIALLVMFSFMSSMFAPLQQEQVQSQETSRSKVWFLGTLTFNNTERSIRDVNFTVGTKNFGEVQIPKEATFYRVDADIGIEPSFGPKPLRLLRIRWEPYGDAVSGGGNRLYLYFPAFGINKSIPFLPWDKPGSLAFHMEDDEMEKTFKFGIEIYITHFGTVVESLQKNPPYTITVIRVSESATNATANPTNNSCEWAGD